MRDLVDLIYEAAFVPEQWIRVLQGASDSLGIGSGQIFFFGDNSQPCGATLDNLRPVFDRFIKGDFWTFCASVQKMCSLRPASFVRVEDFLTAEEIGRDPLRVMLRKFGIRGASVQRHTHADRRVGDVHLPEMDERRQLSAGRDR